jgi:formate-dependent nitrite reductase membrane component NrfD
VADSKGDSRKDVPYDAPWVAHLQHRPDPNRVGQLQTPVAGAHPPRPAGEDLPAHTAAMTAGRTPPQGLARVHDPQSRAAEPSYYDISLLQSPVWKWEIASYFFLGGLSAGAFILGRAADRFGEGRFDDVAKAGAYMAMLSILPAPPLLIHDLGDPGRFHHMLRVFKPSSPMNLGTWVIVGYSGAATVEVLRQYLRTHGSRLPFSDRSKLRKVMENGKVLLVQDAAGVPLALLLASYTGVLLSTSANPLWCKNPWLPPLFTASAISTGAEAILLALDAANRPATRSRAASQRALQTIDTAAHLIEFACVAGFLRHAGKKAEALQTGSMSKHHHLSMASLVASEVLKLVPAPPPLRKPLRMLSAACGLTGGFLLRWAMVFGGHEAASNPKTARLGTGTKAMEGPRAPRKSSRLLPPPTPAQNPTSK